MEKKKETKQVIDTSKYMRQPMEEWEAGKCHGCGQAVGDGVCICVDCIKIDVEKTPRTKVPGWGGEYIFLDTLYGVRHEDWGIKPEDCPIK